VPGRVRGAGRAGGLRGFPDLAGDGVEHALAGDPALDPLAVVGDHGQPVAAVHLDLAQRLGQGFGGEQDLRFYVDDMSVTLSSRRLWLKFLVTSIGP